MEDTIFVAEDEMVVPKLGRPTTGPNVFEVALSNYPVQPWLNSNANLSQWFNYGFNPSSFTRYCIQQTKLYQKNLIKDATERPTD